MKPKLQEFLGEVHISLKISRVWGVGCEVAVVLLDDDRDDCLPPLLSILPAHHDSL